MVSNILKKVFGSRNERLVKKLQKEVAQINLLEPELEKLSDADLRAKTERQKNSGQGWRTAPS